MSKRKLMVLIIEMAVKEFGGAIIAIRVVLFFRDGGAKSPCNWGSEPVIWNSPGWTSSLPLGIVRNDLADPISPWNDVIHLT